MPGSVAAALSGLGLGLSLIVAIGAQNAFVLRQGLRGEHLAPSVAVCVVSDVLLIAAGVHGAAAVLLRWPALLTGVRIGGATFLAGYGFLAARRALRPAALVPDAAATPRSLTGTLGVCLALTWLNPHVYLDTVVLLGSIAQTYTGHQWWFAAGAAGGSTLWFVALGYGARVLRPLFARPIAWRLLDATIAAVMLALATSLAISAT